MIRRPPRSTLSSSSAASDVYKRQTLSRGSHQTDGWDDDLEELPSPSMSVATKANVPRELARMALRQPEVAFSPGREEAAVEWLLQQDLNEIADRFTAGCTDSSPLTSPGPFRR
eukprot:TRINITY_DN35059_c0_g1_i1.p1 TRINITY_DN35059_c0_g1~~TRINITY_DN35059_c0_g1_i1.p1  ORF type:complete len:114 (+),score=37.07 TRINITY_DN35059_c0_g1_i1:115-456(+)